MIPRTTSTTPDSAFCSTPSPLVLNGNQKIEDLEESGGDDLDSQHLPNMKEASGHYLSVDSLVSSEIRWFRTSLISRRFPGLKDLNNTEILSLLNSKLRGSFCGGHKDIKTYPNSRTCPEKKRNTLSNKIDKRPFLYINPYQAKQEIAVKYPEMIPNSYNDDHDNFVELKNMDESKRLYPQRFVPNNASKAKLTISNKVFINSADENTLSNEGLETQDRISGAKRKYKSIGISN